MCHNDPHVVILALTLLDACINNCGKNFHLEVASRDFETEYRRLLGKVEPTVAQVSWMWWLCDYRLGEVLGTSCQ